MRAPLSKRPSPRDAKVSRRVFPKRSVSARTPRTGIWDAVPARFESAAPKSAVGPGIKRIFADRRQPPVPQTSKVSPVQVRREIPARRPSSAVAEAVPADFPRSFGAGRPLNPVDRSFFEPRFGHDFSGVSIHSGPRAAAAAASIDASAFTLGRDVVFGAGRYAPGSETGRRLLAHELAHVVQQGDTTVRTLRTIRREKLGVHSSPPDKHSSTGHAAVSLIDKDDKTETWGFYPACTKCIASSQCTDWELLQIPFGVPGRVCDDRFTTFRDSIDYSITNKKHAAAKKYIDAKRKKPPQYVLSNFSCVHFVEAVAAKAGVTIPDLPGVDEPADLSAYIGYELDRRLVRSGTLGIKGAADSGNVDIGDDSKPYFEVAPLPTRHGLEFRWVISDSANNSYLMWGDSGPVFQYGRQHRAYIGSKTRALLRKKGIRTADILCRVIAGRMQPKDQGGSVNKLLKLSVNFTW